MHSLLQGETFLQRKELSLTASKSQENLRFKIPRFIYQNVPIPGLRGPFYPYWGTDFQDSAEGSTFELPLRPSGFQEHSLGWQLLNISILFSFSKASHMVTKEYPILQP